MFTVSAAPIFKDLGNAKWAENEILYLHDKNVVTGYPNGNFGVNDTIRRADAALMLARAKNLDLEKVSMNPSFPDVDKDAYYYQAVEAAAEAGYINGYPNGNFGPDDTLTREQMAKIIATAYEYTPIEEAGNYFSDINNTWAKSYINTIAANGISNGSPDGTFNPKKNITRAEFSVMLTRAMNDAYKVQPPTIHKEPAEPKPSQPGSNPNGTVTLVGPVPAGATVNEVFPSGVIFNYSTTLPGGTKIKSVTTNVAFKSKLETLIFVEDPHGTNAGVTITEDGNVFYTFAAPNLPDSDMNSLKSLAKQFNSAFKVNK